jgi:hypothetical protein
MLGVEDWADIRRLHRMESRKRRGLPLLFVVTASSC